MKLQVAINGIEETIEILAPAPDCRFRLGQDAERGAEVQVPEPGVYSVLMGGRSYDARVEEHPNRLVIALQGYRFEVAVRDPRRLSHGDARRGRQAIESIASPMPGKVVRVLVAPGDAVETGQGLVVVEAMKMQNEMKAAHAGRVATVPAREGATVAAGEVLATIE